MVNNFFFFIVIFCSLPLFAKYVPGREIFMNLNWIEVVENLIKYMEKFFFWGKFFTKKMMANYGTNWIYANRNLVMFSVWWMYGFVLSSSFWVSTIKFNWEQQLVWVWRGNVNFWGNEFEIWFIQNDFARFWSISIVFGNFEDPSDFQNYFDG